MEDKQAPYRMPEGFNPYVAMDAIRGLTDAIHHFILEGPGTEIRMKRGEKAGLDELVEFLRNEVHALHEYLMDIENRTTLRLPMSEEDFDAIDVRRNRKSPSTGIPPDGVRETAPLYAIQ